MARRVEPEWLDELPIDDRRAVRSRRDLARVNGLMSNAGIVARLLKGKLPPGTLRIAEIGAGDGRFAARLVRRLEGREGRLVLVDRAPCVDAATARDLAAAGWMIDIATAEVFEWLENAPGFDVIVANLFLHHFDDAQLARLLDLASRRAALFIACEPRRSAVALTGSHLLGFIGCNDVTRHDAVVSVRAGFTGREISALWPQPVAAGEKVVCPRFGLEEGARGLFSHAFVARRM